jgi:hypothetical protein
MRIPPQKLLRKIRKIEMVRYLAMVDRHGVGLLRMKEVIGGDSAGLSLQSRRGIPINWYAVWATEPSQGAYRTGYAAMFMGRENSCSRKPKKLITSKSGKIALTRRLQEPI